MTRRQKKIIVLYPYYQRHISIIIFKKKCLENIMKVRFNRRYDLPNSTLTKKGQIKKKKEKKEDISVILFLFAIL